MAKLTLTDILGGYQTKDAYNANNALIEAALENTLSRDGTSPNQMNSDLDMNGYDVNNVDDLTATGLASVGALQIAGVSVVAGSTLTIPSAVNVPNVPAGNIAATDVQAALNELDTEKLTAAVTGGGWEFGHAQDNSYVQLWGGIPASADAGRLTLYGGSNVTGGGFDLRSSGGSWIYADEDTGEILFRSGLSTRTQAFKINTAQNLEFLTFGKGIDFSINTPESGMLNQLMTHYEHGEFTPAITVSTGSVILNTSNNTLGYVRIGNLVFVSGEIRVGSVSSPTGQVNLNGLPWSVALLTEGAGFASASVKLHALNATVNTPVAQCQGTSLVIQESDGVTVSQIGAKLQAGTWITVGLTYITDQA
jgi:hypothetical protein